MIHLLVLSMYSARRVPGWPSTYPFPQGETPAFFKNCFFRFFSPLPFRTIAHTLVRTVSPALCRFARSDTPWPQGSRAYSARKKFHMPWAHGPANIIAFPIDFASRFPPGTLGTWILEKYIKIDFASRFPPMTRLVRMAPVYGISQ